MLELQSQQWHWLQGVTTSVFWFSVTWYAVPVAKPFSCQHDEITKSAGTVTIYLLLTAAMRSGKAGTIPTDRPFLRITLEMALKGLYCLRTWQFFSFSGNKTINPLKFCLYRSRRSYCNHFCWLSKWINNNVAAIHISWTGRLRKSYGIVYIRLQLTLSLVIR